MSEEIAQRLKALPIEIAANATEILNHQRNKEFLDSKIAEIEITIKSQVGADKTLTNDTTRKSAIQDLLNKNTVYEELCISRDRVSLDLEHARINYQRRRDTMNCLIAIAGMMK